MKPPRPISVMHVLNSCYDSSITRIVERIIQALGNDDFSWTVVGVKGMGERIPILQEYGARMVDASPDSNPNTKPWQIIQQQIREGGVQIIHTHTPRTINEVTKALHLGNPPPRHSVVHIGTKHILATPGDRKWGFFFMLADYLSMYFPDYLVPVSKTMGIKISKLPGLSGRVHPIPNAIPVQHYFHPEERNAARSELKIPPETIALGYAGRLTCVKRLDLMLETFAIVHSRYPQSILVLAGDGDQYDELKVRATNLGISDAVFWTGFTHNIPRLLAALDIYVQSSINEGLSLSLLEAMSAGLPVVATRVASAEEIIKPGETGFLVEPGQPEQMAVAVENLVSQPELRKQIGEHARQSALRNHNISVMTDAYRSLYNKVIQKIGPEISGEITK